MGKIVGSGYDWGRTTMSMDEMKSGWEWARLGESGQEKVRVCV